MPGKKIGDLDVYDDVNTDKSRRDLLEISKNTGTYGSPTYATNGSRKITIEQLKDTLFIKDINSYNQVTTGSPTFDKQAYNGISNAGTYTLPTSVGNYEVLAIFLEVEINVTINGLGTGVSSLVFSKQDETAYLIDTTYGWLPLAVNKEVNSSAFELLANKENTTLDTSSTKYPTNNLVKTYVDNLGNTLTSGLATKLTIASNLSELTNTTQARDNLLLGATNDVTHNSITLSNTTVSTLPFIDNAKKIISATGALLGTWFQTLTADTAPVDADTIVVNDSIASFEAKKTTLLQFWSNYLLGKVQALGYLIGSGLTTNNTLKWNGSQIVNANETDNGTTITSTLNRVFTGASASNNGTGANSNKFRFNGVNTIATGSFIQVDPEMQFAPPAVGGSLRGILYLDASANTYSNNGYNQLFLNSGGDLINSKISLRRAIYINHRSADNLNNAGYNSSAVTIDATMYIPKISAVSRDSSGVHHITSVNADNYSSIIQAGASGSNPIHYSAYSQRDNALAYNHWKDASVSSGVLNHARNILVSNTTTFSNGFGFKVENFIATSNISTYVALEEEVIVQSVGTGTTTSGKRYRHVNYTNGVASAYIMGLYAGGVIIGNTTALPNANASLHLQSTSKGFLPNVLTTAQRDAVSWVAGDAGMIIYNSTTNKHQGWNGTTWNDMY